MIVWIKKLIFNKKEGVRGKIRQELTFRKCNLCNSVSMPDCFGPGPYIRSLNSPFKNPNNQHLYNHLARSHQINLQLEIFLAEACPV